MKSNSTNEASLKFKINREKYKWPDQYITGSELRKLGSIPDDEELFLQIKKPWEDELIGKEDRVNLARPEIERFFSKKTCKEVSLIVNGRPKTWKSDEISFKQVVELALGTYVDNPNKVYTVTYDRGPRQNPEGTMVRGDEVCVKNKMIFNVTCTDKS